MGVMILAARRSLFLMAMCAQEGFSQRKAFKPFFDYTVLEFLFSMGRK
jgi:hypothetical protein